MRSRHFGVGAASLAADVGRWAPPARPSATARAQQAASGAIGARCLGPGGSRFVIDVLSPHKRSADFLEARDLLKHRQAAVT